MHDNLYEHNENHIYPINIHSTNWLPQFMIVGSTRKRMQWLNFKDNVN